MYKNRIQGGIYWWDESAKHDKVLYPSKADAVNPAVAGEMNLPREVWHMFEHCFAQRLELKLSQGSLTACQKLEEDILVGAVDHGGNSPANKQKAEIVKRHLLDKIVVSELCEEYEIQPTGKENRNTGRPNRISAVVRGGRKSVRGRRVRDVLWSKLERLVGAA